MPRRRFTWSVITTVTLLFVVVLAALIPPLVRQQRAIRTVRYHWGEVRMAQKPGFLPGWLDDGIVECFQDVLSISSYQAGRLDLPFQQHGPPVWGTIEPL